MHIENKDIENEEMYLSLTRNDNWEIQSREWLTNLGSISLTERYSRTEP